MRVALFTNKTTQASLGVLECLANSSRLELVHVFFHDTVANARGSPWQTLRQFGLKSVAEKVSQQFSSRLRLARGRWGGTGSVRPHSALELAAMQRLSHSIIADMNRPEVISCVHDLQLDVMVVCVCKNILRRQLLALPRTRFVNIHPSLLPQYRGPCPIFWALYHGERLTGVTLHQMTTKIDQGSILAQCSLELDFNLTETQIESQLFRLAAAVLEDTLCRLLAGQPPQYQPLADVPDSYFSFPTTAERRELRKRLRSR